MSVLVWALGQAGEYVVKDFFESHWSFSCAWDLKSTEVPWKRQVVTVGRQTRKQKIVLGTYRVTPRHHLHYHIIFRASKNGMISHLLAAYGKQLETTCSSKM